MNLANLLVMNCQIEWLRSIEYAVYQMTKITYRKGYIPPKFLIPKISLVFLIKDEDVEVTSTMQVVQSDNQKYQDSSKLILNGENIKLISLEVEGLQSVNFDVTDKLLIIYDIPFDVIKNFTLKIKTICSFKNNLEHKGIFVTDGILTSHCEPEGFRRITYFPDRPDILSIYNISIEANKDEYPIILSNGNLVEKIDLTGNAHRVTWQDPNPKPCYLFAVVAGKIFLKERKIISDDGVEKILQFWANNIDIKDVDYALDCLQNAIQWESHKFGLNIDIDCYKVAAIKNFPVGGMENKGLNIFNSRLICTNKKLTTDMGFLTADGIIAHEYFHNWTGNRVACRDWFQLSLKEGLTVFRDQEYCSDQSDKPSGRAWRRIQVINAIKTLQFSENAGSLAHAILPNSYKKIENFYSATTYIKSAEIIRMLSIILGIEEFNKSFIFFLKEFDGKTTTWDDFFLSIERKSGVNLAQFKRWLHAKKTPKIKVYENYSSNTKKYELILEQSGSGRNILHIPLITKLIFKNTEAIEYFNNEFLINLKCKKQKFLFENVPTKPILSLNRNFSSPVIIESNLCSEKLLQNINFDDNEYIRWDSVQQLFSKSIISGSQLSINSLYTLKRVFLDRHLSPEFKAQLFIMPSNEYLCGLQSEADPYRIECNKIALYKNIALYMEGELLSEYLVLFKDFSDYKIDINSIGIRALKNLCLEMLLIGNNEKYSHLAVNQFYNSNNLTDEYGALLPFVKYSCEGYEELLEYFYVKNSNHEKIVDMWISLYAIQIPNGKIDIIQRLKNLINNKEFGLNYLSRMNSLLQTYFYENSLSFHDPSCVGYNFWSDTVLMLDKINPSLAAQGARVLMNWQSLKTSNKIHIESLIRSMLSEHKISDNLEEVLAKMLKY